MRTNSLSIMQAKQIDPATFNFDNFYIPGSNVYDHLSPYDVQELYNIATSIKLSSNINRKYEMIDRIMRMRDFKRLAGGTNRVVYKSLNNESLVFKIAIDKVGMQDNPMEFQNQQLLKPFCTKMFSLDQTGVVSCCERVLPIMNKKEFALIADDVFDILVMKILGKYVIDDAGASRFMNWGIRKGFGPVILDFPYLFELDGSKLYCQNIDSITGQMCLGEIDYDVGFDNLVCTRCGKKYPAKQLEQSMKEKEIKVVDTKDNFSTVKISVKRGDEILLKSQTATDFIIPPKSKGGN